MTDEIKKEVKGSRHVDWRILASLMIVGIAAFGIGMGTLAYFSDTETSTGNVVQAGTIDLKLSRGEGWVDFDIVLINLSDIKPGQDRIVTKYLKVTANPSNVWMRIKNMTCDTGIITDAESEADPENNINDLDTQIYYDLKVCIGDDCRVIYSFDEQDLETLSSLESKWIPLWQNLDPGVMVTINQSFHFNEEAGNEYQGDRCTFSEEFSAYQLGSPGPTGNTLSMENKDSNWIAIDDGMNGTLMYNSAGDEFEYTFEAHGLDAGIEYCLIYYADPWPGDGETHSTGALIATFTAVGGDIASTSGSVNLDMDLPDIDDDNYPSGAKIWLIPCSDYSEDTPGNPGYMTGWHQAKYLFENNPVLIHYEDTDA